MQKTIAHLLLVGFVSASIFFVQLGGARLWDRDEPRNAGCAREMIERNDWIVPTFNDQLRHQKPVLLYWFIMSAYAMFGENEFAARFWSAMFGVGTVLLTYGMTRRLFDAATAILAAVILSTSMMFIVAARAATPDSTLIFFTTLAMAIYVWGTFSPQRGADGSLRCRHEGCWFPRHLRYSVPLFVAIGFAVLAKGPVGAVVPLGVIGLFCLVQRLPTIGVSHLGRLAVVALYLGRLFHPRHVWATIWSMRPLTAALVILGVAAPWYVAVGIATDGQWLRMFFLHEHFGRATTTFESHGGGWWFYPLAILVGFFPWSVLAIPVIANLDRRLTFGDSNTTGTRLMLCWIAVQVGLFSFAATKLPSYVTPCYPALAAIVAAALSGWLLRGQALPGIRLSFAVLVFCGIAIATACIAIDRVLLPGTQLLALLGVVPAAMGIAGLLLVRRLDKPKIIGVLSGGAIALALLLFGWATTVLDDNQASAHLARRIESIDAQSPVIAYRCMESSWVYYHRRPIFEVGSADQIREAIQTSRSTHASSDPVPPSITRFASRVDHSARANEAVWVITTDEAVADLQEEFGSRVTIVETMPYFLRRRQIVLARIAPEPPITLSAEAFEEIGHGSKNRRLAPYR